MTNKQDVGDEPAPVGFHPISSKAEQARKVAPFHEWAPAPITVPEPPSNNITYQDIRGGIRGWVDATQQQGRDSHGQPFVDLGIISEYEVLQREQQAAKRPEANANSRASVSLADSWRIGREDGDWVEPEGSSKSSYDISRPPFSRLMDATLDFFFSRCIAFNDKTNLRLFNSLRHNLGLSTQVPGLHWPGLGADAERYTMTHAAKRNGTTEQRDQERAGYIGEVCPLLATPELAVRRVLALAREEADGGDLREAMLLAEMIAALMGFLEYYNVLPDVYITYAFGRATAMAKAGACLLVHADLLESEIKLTHGLNAAAWSLLCHDDEGKSSSPSSGSQDGHPEGSWIQAPTNTKDGLSIEEAIRVLGPMCAPLNPREFKVLAYLPYDRRRIVDIMPAEVEGPYFARSELRIRTVSAPWTEDDPWAKFDTTRCPSTASSELSEKTLHEAPAELDFWVDSDITDVLSFSDFIGMGLRASWAKVGISEEQSWWILSLKDYVLPAMWQQTEKERKLAANDPKAPWVLDPDAFAPLPLEHSGKPVQTTEASVKATVGAAESVAAPNTTPESSTTVMIKEVEDPHAPESDVASTKLEESLANVDPAHTPSSNIGKSAPPEGSDSKLTFSSAADDLEAVSASVEATSDATESAELVNPGIEVRTKVETVIAPAETVVGPQATSVSATAKDGTDEIK